MTSITRKKSGEQACEEVSMLLEAFVEVDPAKFYKTIAYRFLSHKDDVGCRAADLLVLSKRFSNMITDLKLLKLMLDDVIAAKVIEGEIDWVYLQENN